MIRLGFRLLAGGGREPVWRLVVIALAVSIGVGMLLGTLATMNAVGRQNARAGWLASTPAPAGLHPRQANRAGGPPGSAPQRSVWWLVTTDQYGGQLIVRVDLAAAGRNAPVPPGIPRLPGPGQFYASPALARLLRSTPAGELGDRFPGRQVGTIGASGLASPSDLVIVVGHRAPALARVPGAGRIGAFATSPASGGPDSLGSAGLEAVLAVMALVLLFPVLVFIGTATRLSAARREQRLASIHLVGATLRQVAVIAAVEAVAAAAAGTALGFALYFLAHPALLHVSFTGQPLQPGDLSLSLTDVLLVALGVPLAAGITARVSLRRVRLSPLGVTRRATPSRPRVYRLIPLAAGIAELAYFVAAGHPKSAGGQTGAYFLGFILIMFGLVLAGPWFTMAGALAMARRTRRVPALIAGRRLADNPRGGFRAISGLILALFVTSVAIGTIATLLAEHGATVSGSAATDTVVDQFGVNLPVSSVPSVPAAVLARLRSVSGVRAITLVYTAPAGTRTAGPVPDINGIGGTIQAAVVSCAQLARTPALGRCPRGAAYASVGPDLGFMPLTKPVGLAAATTWPAASLRRGLAGHPVQVVAVATDGSPATEARVATVLDAAFPYASSVGTFGQVRDLDQQLLAELQTVSEVVIVASLLIAGCSLAVSMAGGISERRRPFSLLRLAGTPVRVLHRVAGLEAAAPLVVIALGASLIGLLAADLFLRSQLGITLRLPGAGYFGIVFGGLLASLGVIALTLPLTDRMSGPEVARNE